MYLGLQGKVALVPGAGSQKGFGKAIALTLVRESCDVIVSDIDLKGAQQTADEIEVLGRKAISIKADVSSSTEVNAMVKTALVEFGKIDILVNNAGATHARKPFIEITEVEINADINVNLKGAINCTKAVVSQMISRKSGKIINISSIGTKKGKPLTAAYGAAKGGVVSFTQCLAAELAPLGININCIAPGLGLIGFGGGAPPPKILEKVLEDIPSRRTTRPEDIANTIAFLASEVSIHIVGQHISVDGGESII